MSTERQQDKEDANTAVIDSAPIIADESTEKNLKPLHFQAPKDPQIPENETGPEDIQIIYPSGLEFGVISISLCLCVFLVGLDATILTTAIPRITDEFHSVADVGWYDAAFRLTSCMSQLSQGKLFNHYNVKWVFLINIVIFEIGILISGLAPSSVVFIIGRAITGLGFSGISQGCMIIIAMSRPLRQRPTYIGLISASEFLATAVAPLLGGALTSALSWRWCFYINIPLAAAPAAILLFFLKLPTQVATRHMSQREKLRELDFLGFTFFAPAVLCLLLALQWGGSAYAWSNGRIVALFILSPILFGIFCFIQTRKQEKAMLPPYIIMKGTIAVASIYSLSLSASRAIVEYYLPIWFQAVRGASPLQSGVNTLPLVVSVLIFAVLSGLIISYTGSYKLIMGPASLCVVTGVALMTTLTVTSPSRLWIPSLVLLGIGTGSGISTPFIAAQTILDPSDMSIGMAIMTFSQDIGEALFISIAQAIFLNRLVSNLRETVPLLNPSGIVQLGATNIYGAIPSQDLAGVKISYNQAVKSTMYVSVSLAACMVIAGCAMHRRTKSTA